MEIITETVNGVTVFRISGYMVADTIDTLKRELERERPSPINKVVFDLENVRMIDSSGLGAIVFLVKRCRAAGGDVKVAAAQGHVTDVFELVGFHKAIEMYPTVAEAIVRFRER